MKTYTIVFDYQEGNFEISIETNYTFNSDSHKKAMEFAEKLQNLICFLFKPYYDKTKEDFVIDIPENEYYDDVFISNFKFYDEAKGDYIHLDLGNGQTLYPDANPDCYVELRKDQFINLLKEHYKEYLQDKEISVA
jgi:hypothetical protein